MYSDATNVRTSNPILFILRIGLTLLRRPLGDISGEKATDLLQEVGGNLSYDLLKKGGLLRADDSRPVTPAKVYLVANTVFSLVLAVIYSTNDLPEKARTDLITQGISNLIVTSILYGIWFLYFTKSRRVRATCFEEGFDTADGLTRIGITRASDETGVQVDNPVVKPSNRSTVDLTTVPMLSSALAPSDLEISACPRQTSITDLF